MGQTVPVRVGETEFYVEVVDEGGPRTVGLDDVLSFDGVRDTIDAIASQLAEVWDKVRPNEATIEFGVSLTAKNGKLTGLIVEGGGSASLKVTLAWKRSVLAP